MHGLPLVIKQLSNSNSGVQRAAIRLLSVLFPNADNRESFRLLGGIPPLLGLLTSGSAEIRKSALLALAMLSDPKCIETISLTGGVNALIEQLEVDDTELQLGSMKL